MRQRIGFIIAVAGTFALAAMAQDEPTTRPAGELTVVPSTQPAHSGTIRGRVSIEGGPVFQRPDLSRAIVYLASSPLLDQQPGPTTRATVSQRNKSFTPNFLIIPKGTEVEFPNWDKFDHNVFSRSAAAPAFDLDRYRYGQSKVRKFDKLGVVQLFCNIHPQMRSVIYVTPNAFFARAASDGTFEIAGLPPGTYELTAWHERCEEQRANVQVAGDDQTIPDEVNFMLKETRERVLNSTDDRKASYGVERGLGVKRERLDLPVVKESHPAPVVSQPE